MASKSKKSKVRPVSESVIRKFIRGMVKAVFWFYALAVLTVIGVSLWLSIQKDFEIISHLMTVVQVFSVAVLGILLLGILFKLLRKRTLLLPLLILGISFIVQNLADYLPAVTPSKKAVQTITYSAMGGGFTDTLSDYSGNTIGYISYDAKIISADNSKYEHVSENSVKLAAQEPVSTFSIDVDTSSYANVRGYLNRNQLPPKDAIRVEEMINYFPYNYALPESKKQPFAIHTTLTESPWKKGNKLLHIGIKGYEQESSEEKPLNLVLLIDTSGSMEWNNRLDILKKGFAMLVDQMTEKDTLSIVTYAGSSEVLLQPTSGANKRKIKSVISALSANGGTWGEGGLKMAYELAEANFDKNAINRILLGTDGDFNIGNVRDESLTDYVSRHSKKGIYLSILNVGQDNYNDALMQKLAQSGNGVGYYLDSVMEAKRVLSDDIKKTLFPIADDVKIQVEFNPAKVAEYRLIGYETRLLNREDFNNDQVDAGEINAGHTVTALYEITPVGSENQLVDELRYAKPTTIAPDKADETAFVRVRYKLPGEKKSNLIEQAVVETTKIEKASDDVRFSIAVAAFGQKLRGSNFVDWTWKDIKDFAKSAIGDDEYEYRQEFISLIKKAEALIKAEKFDPNY